MSRQPSELRREASNTEFSSRAGYTHTMQRDDMISKQRETEIKEQYEKADGSTKRAKEKFVKNVWEIDQLVDVVLERNNMMLQQDYIVHLKK